MALGNDAADPARGALAQVLTVSGSAECERSPLAGFDPPVTTRREGGSNPVRIQSMRH
jgi:hypothetical protein